MFFVLNMTDVWNTVGVVEVVAGGEMRHDCSHHPPQQAATGRRIGRSGAEKEVGQASKYLR